MNTQKIINITLNLVGLNKVPQSSRINLDDIIVTRQMSSDLSGLNIIKEIWKKDALEVIVMSGIL